MKLAKVTAETIKEVLFEIDRQERFGTGFDWNQFMEDQYNLALFLKGLIKENKSADFASGAIIVYSLLKAEVEKH